MRRLVWSLILIVALFAILDRVALGSAEHDVAARLQADASLSSAPDVSIHGYPFLTQLVAGDYDNVEVGMRDLDSDGLRIDRLAVHVHGAHVSLWDVLNQDRSRIRVDRATADLLLTYADLDAFVRQRAGTPPPKTLDDSVITGVSVRGGNEVVLRTSFGKVPLTLKGLPFGIRLTSAKATQAGVTVSGAAERLTLRT